LFWDIVVIVGIIVAAIVIGLYFLNKWAGKKMAVQQEAVEKNKQTVTIYVIDKKKDKLTNANFPKAVYDQIPRWSKIMKTPLVKAKIGPQIMTLMCDAKVYNVLPVKKSVKVDLAGMYIVDMKGMKTKKQMDEIRKARKFDKNEPKPAGILGNIKSRLSFGK
jgi:hypothetical protein